MRVKTEAKRQEILQIAGKLFLSQGYGAVTMAAVAAELGGSKGTLYGYFPNKEDLFAAFIRQAGEEAYAPLENQVLATAKPSQALEAFGISYLKLLLHPDIIAIVRLVVSEAVRVPELAEIFFRIGPRRVTKRFEQLFVDLSTAGLLHLSDAARAALEFKVLCEAGLYEPLLLGGRAQPSAKEMEANVAAAVEIMIARYG
ncbi:MAG: TetR/AcrR family transcriptional regulator [Rhizobium sp.]